MERISPKRRQHARRRFCGMFTRALRHCAFVVLFVPTVIAGPASAQFMPGQEGAISTPAAPPQPRQPTALIEEVTAPVNGLQEMDYVTEGTVLTLAPKQRIVLDYLASCTRETVSGGSITIGDQQSTVRGGHIERQHVTCPGQALQLAAYQAQVAAIMPIRAFRQPSTSAAPPVARTSTLVTLDGTSPVLLLSIVATVQIEDLSGGVPPIIVGPEAIRAPAGADRRRQGYMVDLVDQNIRLFPGGLYRATQGLKHVDFMVASTATNGRLPLMSRLLPL